MTEKNELSIQSNKKRIWELDFIRGLCIVIMVLVHIPVNIFYMTDLTFTVPKWLEVLIDNGHLFFVLISGICVTLASSSLKRGAFVFLTGCGVSYVTLYLEVFLDVSGVRIWFGILHALGLCMILYPIFKKMPTWLLSLFGVGFIILGVWFKTINIEYGFLFPIGLRSRSFNLGSDYVPLFPALGWFLLGAVIGRLVYKDKKTFIPKANTNNVFIRFFSFCGRNSLTIYLLHQPIITLIVLIFVH